jgi:hypothetical protein
LTLLQRFFVDLSVQNLKKKTVSDEISISRLKVETLIDHKQTKNQGLNKPGLLKKPAGRLNAVFFHRFFRQNRFLKQAFSWKIQNQ